MAQYALPPGAVRKRAVFGLIDRDGWTWATIKATFWFLLIIFLLGYVPDRAYYLTVSPTIDLGFNAISPINLCPAENNGLPCPAPAGAVIPWEQSPENLSLPGRRPRRRRYLHLWREHLPDRWPHGGRHHGERPYLHRFRREPDGLG